MSFTAKIDANVTGLSEGVDKAGKEVAKLEKDVSQKLKNVGDQFMKIGKAASVFSGAIAGAAAGVFYFSKRAGDMASDLLSATIALDSSADMLQEYEFIASQAGTSTDAFSRGVEAMTRRLKGAGDEGDNTTQIMRSLGVAINGTDGSMRRTGDIANDLILRLADMENVSERNVLASQLFGRSWAQIAPILEGGSAGIESVRQQAHELGIVLDGDALDGMANFSIEANKLGMQFKAIGNNLASEFAPLLSGVIVPIIEEKVIPAIQAMADRISQLINWFQGLSAPAQETILAVTGIAAAFGPVMVAIGGVLKILPLLKAGFIAATGPIGLIVAAVAGAAILIIRYWDEIKEYFTSGGGSGIFNTIMETVSMLRDFFAKAFDGIKKAVLSIWDSMGGDLIRIINNAISAVVIVIETIVKTIKNVVKIITSIFQGDFKGALDGLKNLFMDIFIGIGRLVATAIANIASSVAGFFRLIGLDGIADSISKFAERLSPPVQKFKKNVDDAADSVDELTESTEKNTRAVGDQATAYGQLSDAMEEAFQDGSNIQEVIWRTTKSVETLTERLEGLRSGAIVVENVREEIEKTEKKINDLNNALNDLQGDREVNVILNIGSTGGGIDSMIDDINERALASMGVLKETLADQINQIQESVVIGMIDTGQLLGQGITDFADIMGNAFATGDWDNMGNELLSALGGLAQQMGATLISMGTAALALRLLITNPFTAIAAGIALVALGAAAKAAASKQVSQATGGSAGGGGGASGGYRDRSTPGASEYRGAWQDDFKVEFVQKGSDLVGVLDTAEQRRRRS